MNTATKAGLIFLVTFLVLQLLFLSQSHKQKEKYAEYIKSKLKHEGGEGEDHNIDYRKLNATEYYKWCHDVEHNTIYNLGSKLNCRDNSESFSMSFMIAILVTFLIELVLHALQSTQHKIYLRMLSSIYKELMMMGMIGFVVNAGESLGVFELFLELGNQIATWLHLQQSSLPEDVEPETKDQLLHRRVLIFDFVHILLFVNSIFYVAIVVVCYLLVRYQWKKWAKFETYSQEEAKKEQKALKEEILNSNKTFLLFRWKLLFDYTTAVARTNYLTLKRHFFLLNEIQVEKFQFHAYLKECIVEMLCHLVEVDWKIWLLIWAAFATNYVRNKIVDISTGNGGVLVFVLVVGCTSLVAMMIQFVIFRYNTSRFVRDAAEQLSAADSLQKPEEETNFNTQPKGYQTADILPADEYEDEFHVISVPFTELPMSRYFALRMPKVSLFVMQMCILIQCFYLAMMTIHFGYVIVMEPVISDYLQIRLLVLFLCFLPSFAVFILLFPLVVPYLTMLYYLGDRTNFHFVEEVMNKLLQKEEKAVLADAGGHHNKRHSIQLMNHLHKSFHQIIHYKSKRYSVNKRN